MRLATLKYFRSLIYAPGSEPSMATLRAKIAAGKIAGGVVTDGRYYVDLDAFDTHNGVMRGLSDRRKELVATPELEGLL